MSSILATSVSAVGTQTTSFPAWPTEGSNGFCWAGAGAGACADNATPRTTAVMVTNPRVNRLFVCTAGRRYHSPHPLRNVSSSSVHIQGRNHRGAGGFGGNVVGWDVFQGGRMRAA